MYKIRVVAGIVSFIALIGVFFFTVRNRCVYEPVVRENRGSSLIPLVQNGETITVLRGYYGCHPVRRGDIVAYRLSENGNWIIKIVKGVPRDSFVVFEREHAYELAVNGQVLQNSYGDPYRLPVMPKNLFSDTVNPVHRFIPFGAYLLIGNRVEGTFDSTKFGFAAERDLIGKVILSQ